MVDLDVEALDVYFNLTFASTQLMNGKVPWGGGRENDYELMQILMEVLTTPLFVILDVYIFINWFMIYIQNVQ